MYFTAWKLGQVTSKGVREVQGRAWTGLIWLTIGTGSGAVVDKSRNLGFHKIREISWLVEGLLAYVKQSTSCI